MAKDNRQASPDAGHMTFDFVVVGAGSAGCPLASRLSESGKYSVALVEAGPRDTSPWIHVPVGYFRTMGNPRFDWCYVTQPDAGLNGRSIPWPRGRVLGGSSSINGLLYVRGQKEDFDHWRRLGNPGWGWEDVLPYFRRAETWHGGAAEPDGLRGGSGPLSVSESRFRSAIVDRWIEAAHAAGYPKNPDYNGADQEGVGYFQLTLCGGRRCSSAAAYLRPARGRRNLSVFTNLHAVRIGISDRRATHLEALRDAEEVRISARREIVLSAGAIGSPQILMLSGIGDGSRLRRHGIEVYADLPGVGKNLQDHLQARPIFKTTLPTINSEASSLLQKAIIGLRYVLTRSGPMTMATSLGAGFLKTDSSLATPDIQFHIQPFSATTPAAGPHEFSAFTASVLQLRPESTGRIDLRSADPKAHPLIIPNYLTAVPDQKSIVKGIRIARRIANFQPLKDVVTEEFSPGPAVADDDEQSLLAWARNTSVTIYHPTGTCKMGDDPMAVVDARLRVRNIEGLRVADASIMPRITSGNTNAPCIMIGEKAANLIQEDCAA